VGNPATSKKSTEGGKKKPRGDLLRAALREGEGSKKKKNRAEGKKAGDKERATAGGQAHIPSQEKQGPTPPSARAASLRKEPKTASKSKYGTKSQKRERFYLRRTQLLSLGGQRPQSLIKREGATRTERKQVGGGAPTYWEERSA